jgi:membrane-bound lytic murein transglycosylase B
MKFILINIFIAKIIFFYSSTVVPSNFSIWIEELETEILDYGVSKQTYSKTLAHLRGVNKKVLKLYNNQPEFKITFDNYYNRNINEKRIKLGQNLLKKYQNILSEIQTKYDVAPEIIVSIWGIETNYGMYMGNFNVIEALATLAYSSRRKSFFKKELLNSLLIYEKNFKDTDKVLIGSWAGAMGQGQFMPSSFLNYAVDYDKDKIVDIWNSHYDIFASIANYLKSHGWKKQNYWSVEVQVKEDFKKKIQENVNYNINIFKNAKILDNFLNYKEIKIKIIKSKEKLRYFAIDKNFKIIKKYNNSDYYALIVGDLANKIKNIY